MSLCPQYQLKTLQGGVTMWPFTRKKKRDPVRRSLACPGASSNFGSDYGLNPLALDSLLDTRAGADSLERAGVLPDHGGAFGGAGSAGDFGSAASDSYSSHSDAGSSS